MFLGVIFIIVLLMCFAIVFFFTRSNETVLAVRRRLATLEDEPRLKTPESTILKQELLSPSPAMHDFLARVPYSFAIQNLIKQAGPEWWVSSVIFYSLLLAFVGFIIGIIEFNSIVLILLTAIAVGALPIVYLFFVRRQKLQKCSALLPQAVELMARALRAGHALNSAIDMVSQDIPEPLGVEFRMVYEEQALGLPLRDALMNLLLRIPTDDMRFLTTALLLQKETGGNLVQILDTTANVMKERKRVRGQIKVYTAQARATAWVVGGLPFFMFILMNLVSPGYEQQMLDDSFGRTVFYGGIVMWALGILIIKKLVTIKV